LEQLHAANARLRNELIQSGTDVPSCEGADAQGHVYSSLYAQLAADLAASAPYLSNKIPCADGLQVEPSPVEPTLDGQAVVITKPALESGPDEGCVAVVDDMDWWVLVPNPNSDDAKSAAAPDVPAIESPGLNVARKVSAQSLGTDDDYVIVDDSAVEAAVAEFIMLTMRRYPNARHLVDRDLGRLLRGTLSSSKDEPSIFGQLWGWGQSMYAAYGWASVGLALYRQPQNIKLLTRVVYSAARWALVLVL